MAYKFKNAIIRKPNKSIKNALSSKNLHPNYEKILKIHSKYINAFREAGLNIIFLEALESYADSIFVEDPAIIYNNNLIILNPSDPSRNGEAKIIKKEIEKYFDNIFYIEQGFVEGGDVLNINNKFVIGLSQRTTKSGAKSLSEILMSLGASIHITKTPNGILHFKSECSLIDDDVILVSKRMSKLDYLKSNYTLIELPIGEEGAANSLRINDKLLLPDGFIKTEEILTNKYNIIKIEVDEISKVDAGLSCMSLRW